MASVTVIDAYHQVNGRENAFDIKKVLGVIKHLSIRQSQERITVLLVTLLEAPVTQFPNILREAKINRVKWVVLVPVVEVHQDAIRRKTFLIPGFICLDMKHAVVAMQKPQVRERRIKKSSLFVVPQKQSVTTVNWVEINRINIPPTVIFFLMKIQGAMEHPALLLVYVPNHR